MAYDTISATNLANWIPDVWSKDVLAATENNLVLGGLFDRSFEQWARDGGDNIVVPNLANLTANVVNTAIDVTLYDTLQNVTNIAINKKYDIAIMVDDINQMQSNPKYFEKVRTKLAYGLAKQIDTNCAATFRSANVTVGTVNVAITDDVILDAYTYLNLENAPEDGRAWAFDPKSIRDLTKLDYFVRSDYVPDQIVQRGWYKGRLMLGSPVYITTNLDAYVGNAYPACYFQKEYAALVMQIPPQFEAARVPLRHADALVGLCVFGVQVMRATFGVCINTRGGSV